MNFNKITTYNEPLDLESLDSNFNEEDLEPIFETFLHGYGESHQIDDLDNQIIQIAHFEGFNPLAMFQDKFSEQMKLSKPQIFTKI